MADGGTFKGSPQVTLLPDGRKLKLIAAFAFTDAGGLVWTTPKDWTVDGASIPQAFWSVIGGPLEGLWRDASVIHDYYCDAKSRTWQATHKVFYDGMIARGVETAEAKTMYYAVYKFGPRWVLAKPAAQAVAADAKAIQITPARPATKAEAQAVATYISSADPTLKQIEALADAPKFKPT
jgi:hypothetical protein